MNYRELYECTDQDIKRGQCAGAQLNFGFHQQAINKRNAVKTQLTRHTEKPTAAGHCRLRSVTQVKTTKICGNKMPTRRNRGFFIAILIACSTCFGHHYAHHQELKNIIQWLLPVVFGAVVFRFLVWCGADGYVSTPNQQLENYSTKYHRQQSLYNTLELLMMGTVVPETC